jgi:ankyrin repeat protein
MDLASSASPLIPTKERVAPTAQSFQARKQQAKLNKQLIQAVGDGDATEVAKLLAMGADVNARGEINLPGISTEENLAIYAAAYLKHNEIVQKLIQHGADVNTAGGIFGSALQVAVRAGNEEGVEYLLEAGADVNAKGGRFGSALHQAALLENTEILKALLFAGADVNAQSPLYGSVLAAAAGLFKQASVRILVDAGADVSTLSDSNRHIVKSIISSR